jgi:hypothetical protein
VISVRSTRRSDPSADRLCRGVDNRDVDLLTENVRDRCRRLRTCGRGGVRSAAAVQARWAVRETRIETGSARRSMSQSAPPVSSLPSCQTASRRLKGSWTTTAGVGRRPGSMLASRRSATGSGSTCRARRRRSLAPSTSRGRAREPRSSTPCARCRIRR